MSFSIYLHFPFCSNRCSYCDFYKELYTGSLESEFFRALLAETELAAVSMGDSNRPISSIFIGGGTPSLVTIELLADWLELLKKHFEFDDDLEFSFESNPESINLENLKALKGLGVNRPIFGIQSFNKKLCVIIHSRSRKIFGEQSVNKI